MKKPRLGSGISLSLKKAKMKTFLNCVLTLAGGTALARTTILTLSFSGMARLFGFGFRKGGPLHPSCR